MSSNELANKCKYYGNVQKLCPGSKGSTVSQLEAVYRPEERNIDDEKKNEDEVNSMFNLNNIASTTASSEIMLKLNGKNVLLEIQKHANRSYQLKSLEKF